MKTSPIGRQDPDRRASYDDDMNIMAGFSINPCAAPHIPFAARGRRCAGGMERR